MLTASTGPSQPGDEGQERCRDNKEVSLQGVASGAADRLGHAQRLHAGGYQIREKDRLISRVTASQRKQMEARDGVLATLEDLG